MPSVSGAGPAYPKLIVDVELQNDKFGVPETKNIRVVQMEESGDNEQKFCVPFCKDADALNFLQDIEAAEQKIDEISCQLEYEKELVVESLDESKFSVRLYTAPQKPAGLYRKI